MDRKKYLKFLEELMNIDSPAGFCDEINNYIEEKLKEMNCEVHYTNKHALYTVLKGRDSSKMRIVTAHVDTLGGNVLELKENGRLSFTNIGGFMYSAIEGEKVRVYSEKGVYTGTVLPIRASVHSFSDEELAFIRNFENMEIRIDKKSENAQDLHDLGIATGDFVAFETNYRLCEDGYIVSRFLDNKADVAIVLSLIDEIVEKNIEVKEDVMFYFTNYEEIGHGTSYVPDKAYEIVALDIGTVAKRHSSKEDAVTIVSKDSRTPYPFEFRRRLEKIAEKEGIRYVVDNHLRYGSDASLGAIAGHDLDFACFGPGVDATHHMERTNILAIEETYKLLKAYLTEK